MRYFLLILLLGLSLHVGAAGMMLSENNNPIQYEDLSVDVQIDNHSQIVSMTMWATFSHESAGFVWLLPLPSADTEISLMLPETFTQDHFTESQLPTNLCSRLFYSGNQGSGGTPDSYPEADSYAHFENADALFVWLEREGFSYPEEAEAIIRDYFATGHPVIALPFEQESPSGVGHIEPIRIQYFSEDLSFWLPLRLTAFSMGESYNYRMDWTENHDLFPLRIRVEADIQYAPVNVPHPTLELEQMQIPNRIQAGQYTLNSAFIALWRETLNEHPEGFVTTRAAENDAGRYITELSAMIAPDAFLIDPVFMPAPDLPDFRSSDYYAGLDAFEYWGCATRNFAPELSYYEHGYSAPYLMNFVLYEEIVANLPDNRMYFPQFWQSMPFPSDWVHSSIEYMQYLDAYSQDYSFKLEVFAPEPVDAEDIRAYQRGEPSPPMIVLSSPYIAEPNTDWASLHYIELASFKREYSRRPDYGVCCRTMVIDLLVSEDEWIENQAMYEAILAFPQTYAFSSHAELQHSIYLAGGNWQAETRFPQFQMGYPAGWVEYYDEAASEIYFLPEGVEDRSQAITISFYPEGFRLLDGEFSAEELEAYLDEMSEAFNLLPEGRAVLRERVLSDDCRSYFPPLALEANGHSGFLVTDILITAASTSPVGNEELRMMAESYRISNDGCG